MFCLEFVCLLFVCLFVSEQLHIKTADLIFVKIFSRAVSVYHWMRKSLLDLCSDDDDVTLG